MKSYRIQPKQYISESYIIDYYDYTKKEAIKLYRDKFKQFLLREIFVE